MYTYHAINSAKPPFGSLPFINMPYVPMISVKVSKCFSKCFLTIVSTKVPGSRLKRDFFEINDWRKAVDAHWRKTSFQYGERGFKKKSSNSLFASNFDYSYPVQTKFSIHFRLNKFYSLTTFVVRPINKPEIQLNVCDKYPNYFLFFVHFLAE